MQTVPLVAYSGGPPMRRITLFLVLAILLLAITGCANRTVSSVPECEFATPPDPAKYSKANSDEQLVMMTASYNNQVRKTSDCNINIQKVNAKNEALFK